MAAGTPTRTSLFFKKRKLSGRTNLSSQFKQPRIYAPLRSTPPSPDLSLCGFTKSDGVFMSAKELLDNAVDACVQRPPDKCLEGAPAIELTACEEDDGVTEICCRDRGVGFSPESVEALGIIFATSKSADPNTGGVFGIGLKVIMLYCEETTKSGLHFRIRVSATKSWSFHLRFLTLTNESSIEDFRIIPRVESDPWVTEVTAKVRGKWDTGVQAALRRLVAASSFLRPQISFSLNMTGALPFYRSSGLLPLGTLLHRWARVVRDASREKIVAMAEKVIDIPDFRIEVATLALMRTKASRMPLPHAKIRLLRVFNCTTLVPEGSPVCGIQKALWRFVERCGHRYGIERRARPLNGGMKISDVSPKPDATETHPPACFLHTLQEAASYKVVGNVNKNSWSEITVEFPTLDSTLSQLLPAVFDAMKSTAPGAFHSVQEIEMKQATEIFVPQLVHSVTNIIRRSPNAEFREAAFLLLGIRDENEWKPTRTLAGNRTASEEPVENILAGKRAKTHDLTDKLEKRLQGLILKKLEDCCTAPCQELPSLDTRENNEDAASPHSCSRSGKEDSDGTESEEEIPCENI